MFENEVPRSEFPLTPDNITFEVMLRDPYYIENKDTPSEALVPMTDHMEWGVIPVKYTHECEHETTVCEECANSWLLDHNVRITADGELLYISPGAPNPPPGT